MRSRAFVLRWALRASTAGVASVLGVAGLAGVAGAQGTATAGRVAPVRSAQSATQPASPGAWSAEDPYSPANGHSYRRGVLPTRGQSRKMHQWASQHAGTAATPSASASDLGYGGGLHGVGVTTGLEKVYLVFWGSQWGQQSADAHGDITLANDPTGEAPYLQLLFKGLGTGGETWSGVMTQYCDGVSDGAMSCPANSWHVAYPTGGALAGVWADESVAAPGHATGHQLGAEAVAAAKHFGNTSSSSNRDAQYVILSPTGTHPDGFNTLHSVFCAWHDDTADPNLPAGPVNSTLDLAFTNMPYVSDAGSSCGTNFVNPGTAGLADGVSIVAGHEYAETITDQLPSYGWSNASGQENGDLCAWKPAGTVGAASDLTLPTGTFAMQSTWANDDGGGNCEFAHPVVANNWVLNGGFESGALTHWTSAGSTTITSSAHSGKYAVRAGRHVPSSGNSSLAQTFTAHGAQLSFWYNVTCPDTVTQSWATATVTDNTTHTTVTVLARTCLAHSGWQQVSHPVIAGHSYTLRLISHDDNDTASGDGTYTLFDDVTSS